MKNELNIRCMLSKDKLPVGTTEQAVYALVKIKPAGEACLTSMPANFGLVLDRSGSMDGEKMDHLKEAVGYVVDHLNDEDLVSITIFDDQVETLIPSQTAGNREEIKSRLGSVIARGGTQISDGLKAGLEEVKKGLAKDRVNRIVLLTDGQTWDDEAACIALADQAGSQGIAITSIGIGQGWNEKLLLEISGRSHGNSHWIENPIAILDAFEQEVISAHAVVATNLRLTTRMSPGVKAVKAYTTVPMICDRTLAAVNSGNIVANLGAVDGTNGQAVLIEARVQPAKTGPFRLGQVEVAYDVPSQNIKGQSIKTDLSVTFTDDAAVASKVNAEVMNLVEKVSAFKLQTRALAEVMTGNIDGATKKLQSAATVLLDLGEDELAAATETEIRSLKKTGALTVAGTKKLEYGTRKLTQALK